MFNKIRSNKLVFSSLLSLLLVTIVHGQEKKKAKDIFSALPTGSIKQVQRKTKDLQVKFKDNVTALTKAEKAFSTIVNKDDKAASAKDIEQIVDLTLQVLDEILASSSWVEFTSPHAMFKNEHRERINSYILARYVSHITEETISGTSTMLFSSNRDTLRLSDLSDFLSSMN